MDTDGWPSRGALDDEALVGGGTRARDAADAAPHEGVELEDCFLTACLEAIAG